MNFFRKLINERVLFNEDVVGSYDANLQIYDCKHANFALIKTSVFHARKSSEVHFKQQSFII